MMGNYELNEDGNMQSKSLHDGMEERQYSFDSHDILNIVFSLEAQIASLLRLLNCPIVPTKTPFKFDSFFVFY